MDTQKQQIVENLKQANNILVTVSNNPSVDQLAACIGVTLALNKMKKHATAVFSGAVPPIIDFLQPDKTLEKNTDSLRDFIIAIDKAKADKLRYKVEDKFVKIFITPYRTSISEKDLQFSEGDFNVDVVLALGVHKQQDLDQAITAHGRILHDATIIAVNTQPNNELGSINLVEPQASSLSEIAVGLLNMLDAAMIDDQVATALLTGIVAETDRFRNAKTTPATMSTSAGLLTAGANQQLVASKLEAKPPEVSVPKSGPSNTPEPPKLEKKPDDGTLEINHEEGGDNKSSDSSDKGSSEPPKPPQIHIDEDGHVHDLEEHKDAASHDVAPPLAPVSGPAAPLFSPPPLNPFASTPPVSSPTPIPLQPLAPSMSSPQMPPLSPPLVTASPLPPLGSPAPAMGSTPGFGSPLPFQPLSSPAPAPQPPLPPLAPNPLNPFASRSAANDLGLPPPPAGNFGAGVTASPLPPLGSPAPAMGSTPGFGSPLPFQPLSSPAPAPQPPLPPPPAVTPPPMQTPPPPPALQATTPEIIQPDPNAMLAQQEKEEAELPPPPSLEPPTIRTEGPRLMTQPPTFGSELNAGTLPQEEDEDVPSGGALNLPQVEKPGLLLNREPLQSPTSPMSPLNPLGGAPTPSTLPPPPPPKAGPLAAPAPAGVPPEPPLLAEESLSSLERDVKSPHLDYIESPAPNLPGSNASSTSNDDSLTSAAVMKPASPEEEAAAAVSTAADAQQIDDVADARTAIKAAFGEPLEPVVSLNAQPLGNPLHEDDNAPPPGFSSDPNSGGTPPPPPVPPPLIPPTPS